MSEMPRSVLSQIGYRFADTHPKWEMGDYGKAVGFPDGKVVAWATTSGGDPHHPDLFPDYDYEVAMQISPDGAVAMYAVNPPTDEMNQEYTELWLERLKSAVSLYNRSALHLAEDWVW